MRIELLNFSFYPTPFSAVRFISLVCLIICFVLLNWLLCVVNYRIHKMSGELISQHPPLSMTSVLICLRALGSRAYWHDWQYVTPIKEKVPATFFFILLLRVSLKNHSLFIENTFFFVLSDILTFVLGSFALGKKNPYLFLFKKYYIVDIFCSSMISTYYLGQASGPINHGSSFVVIAHLRSLFLNML